MALADDAIDEMKTLIAASRRRPVNFGLCLGKRPEDCGLIMHRIKAAEALYRQARKLDGVVPNKSTFGTVETKGKTVTFTCEAPPHSTSAKVMRQFFRGISLPMKVVLVSPDGSVQAEGEDDSQPGAAVEVLDPAADKWENAKRLAEPQVAAFLRAGQGDVSKVRAAWSYACGNADEGDYTGALKVLARLMPLLQSAGPSAAPPGDQDKRAVVKDLLQTLPADLAALKQSNSPGWERIERQLMSGIAAAKREDFTDAAALLIECTDLIAQAKTAARAGEAEATVPEGTVAAQARIFEAGIARWRTERLRSIEGLDALMKALRSDADAELHDIADRIDVIRKDLPAALEDVLSRLDDAIEVGDQAAIARQKTVAQTMTTEAANFLKSNSNELKLCEENPFDLKMQIITPLAESLKGIAASIKRL